MTMHTITATRRIAAPAEVAYGIIADYRDGHPHIVPPKVFKNLRVESGGIGEGTTIRFEMRVLGATRPARGHVAEPSPGRVLTERYDDGAVTTFTVEPADHGRACDVTITTQLSVRNAIERLFTTWFLRRTFAEELSLLDALARRRAASPAHGSVA